jgi:hypothetical protein
MLAFAYRALLREPEVLADLIDFASSQAELRGWVVREAPATVLPGARLRRLDGGHEPPRDLDLAGVWLNPHFGSDDLCLVFDAGSGELVDASRPGETRGFAVARTTWADAATHVAALRFLESLAERDLASIELGDPSGGDLVRDVALAEKRIRDARRAAFHAQLGRPEEPFRLGGVAEFLAPAEAARRRIDGAGPLDRLPERERATLVEARSRLVEAWKGEVPGIEGDDPEIVASALERLTDLLLSHPGYRRDPSYLVETFAWESGVVLGFAIVAALGGQWERVAAEDGSSSLRLANLGGVGLTWRPLHSAGERLRSGAIFAPDVVLSWLRGVVDSARDVFLD